MAPAMSEYKVSVATRKQWGEIDDMVWDAYARENPGSVQAETGHLACAADRDDVRRLVVTLGDTILATQSIQVLWNPAELHAYLGGHFKPAALPLFVSGRSAVSRVAMGGGAFRALVYTGLCAALEIASAVGELGLLNVHKADNPVIFSLRKLSWDKFRVWRTKGVFDGHHAVTYLRSVKALRKSLARTKRRGDVPPHVFEGPSVAQSLLAFRR